MAEFDEKLNSILNNPQAMGQIMALAQSLGGGEGSNPAKEAAPSAAPATAPPPREPMGLPSLGDLDPRFLQIGMRVLKEYQRGDDEKIALLTALRPFLREERYDKLDRAIQIARLSRVIRVLFDAMGRGEERV